MIENSSYYIEQNSTSHLRPVKIVEGPQIIALNNYAMFEKNVTPDDNRPHRLTVDDLYEGIFEGDVVEGLYQNENLIGFSWCIPRKNDLYVKVLAIHPEHQNRGHVRTLLSQAERNAKELDYTLLTLAVDPFNGPGLSAYFHSGYIITDFKEGYYPSNFSTTRRFIMQRDLERMTNQYQEFEKLPVEEYENIKNVLNNGFVGTDLELSPSFNNRKNLIIFQR